MRFTTMWYVRPAKAQISLRIPQSNQTFCSLLEYFMGVKLLTEHHLVFLSLKGGCTCSSESTLVKMPHCILYFDCILAAMCLCLFRVGWYVVDDCGMSWSYSPHNTKKRFIII